MEHEKKLSAAGSAAPDAEVDLWRGRYSPKAMLGNWALCAVLSAVVLIVGAILAQGRQWWFLLMLLVVLWSYNAIVYFYRRLRESYRLTTQRFIHERGILWRTVDRIEVIDLIDVRYSQGPLDRLLGIGSLRILSTDSSDPLFTLRGIDDVKHVADTIDKARRDEMIRRGLHLDIGESSAGLQS